MSAAVEERNPSNDGGRQHRIRGKTVTLAGAYRYCENAGPQPLREFQRRRLDHSPGKKLPHVYAIYAWCRMVDDLGDESLPSEPVATAVDNGKTRRHHRRPPPRPTGVVGKTSWRQSIPVNLRTPYQSRSQHTVDSFDIPRETVPTPDFAPI